MIRGAGAGVILVLARVAPSSARGADDTTLEGLTFPFLPLPAREKRSAVGGETGRDAASVGGHGSSFSTTIASGVASKVGGMSSVTAEGTRSRGLPALWCFPCHRAFCGSAATAVCGKARVVGATDLRGGGQENPSDLCYSFT